MLRGKAHKSGWQGVVLVAVTYVYFLIFAQFAFVHRLASLGLEDAYLKAVMAAMAVGGILVSLIAPRVKMWAAPAARLRAGFVAAGAAALLTLLPLGLASSLEVSFLIGAGLGLLTVTLATDLPAWTGNRNPLFKVGLGTGIGYLICNFPPLFTATPAIQAAAAAALCVAGAIATMGRAQPMQVEAMAQTEVSFVRALMCFTALVWLDSAAFLIIQSSPTLKAGTWDGSVHLWTNGLLHLFAAVASAWLLRKRGLSFVLISAFGLLGVACLLLLDSSRVALASVFYPIGVSLYSVALVAYPSLIAPASSFAERGRKAGWIYAVAGWCGSALGIGMGQNLGHVPPLFVLAAGCAIALPLLVKALMSRRREALATALVLLAALGVDRIVVAGHTATKRSQIERGRQVYISEGCISCHSQYVRPNSPDELMWGPVESVEQIQRQHPPLIGNRRQGPDLAEVGNRRSPLWLMAHFYDPAEVSSRSIMPSFAFLFRDERGDDLLAYLESLKGGDTTAHLAAEQAWHLPATVEAQANAVRGAALFQSYCGTCHNTDGRTRSVWESSFRRLPTNFASGRLIDLPNSDSREQRMNRIAHITKFGIHGTDMPGHEYLPNEEIASISLWLLQNIAQPAPNR